MTANSARARFSALGFLCLVLAVGFGVDFASDQLVARAKANGLLAVLGGLALGDDELCARAGRAVEMSMCLARTRRDGMTPERHRWSSRNLVDQRLSLSVSICERHSRLCVHL
jgi:hypothetical protein